MSMRRSDFRSNVLTVMAGTTGAQILPLLAAPVLTRMCTPADMGAFSVWLGVITVTSIIATLHMETAIVLDHEIGQQRLCFSVVAYCATALALLLTLLAILARTLGLPVVRDMSWIALLTIGLGTWLTAYTQAVFAYAASHNLFRQAAQAKVLRTAAIALSQLALLYAGYTSTGLLAGQLIGLLAGLRVARIILSPPVPELGFTLGPEQRRYLVKHQAFWRYSLPSGLLNTLAGQLPLFMIGMHQGALAAGLFALTQRVLGVPIALIASSILEVFKRQAVHEFESLGHCRDVYRSTFKTLLLLALAPSLILFLFSPQLFSWVFGPDWRQSGELARILAPLYFLNFIANPLSYVFFVAGKQKVELLWQVALFLMTIGVFMAPASLNESVLAYAVGRSVLYIIYLYMSHECSLNRRTAS